MISLSSLKKNLDQKSRLFERYPRDPHVRGALFSTLKTYRNMRKSQIKDSSFDSFLSEMLKYSQSDTLKCLH